MTWELLTFGNAHTKNVKLDHLDGGFDDHAYFQQGLLLEELPRYRLEDGRQFLDCNVSTGNSIIVSKRFKELFEEFELSGLEFNQIQVVTAKRRPKKVECYLIRPIYFIENFQFSHFKANDRIKGGKYTGVELKSSNIEADVVSPKNTGLIFMRSPAKELLSALAPSLSGLRMANLKDLYYHTQEEVV